MGAERESVATCRNCGNQLQVTEWELLGLVAGGGFELQSRIHSGQVIDSATREKGTIGINRDSFLHFSYTFFTFQPHAPLAFIHPAHEATLPHNRNCGALCSRLKHLPRAAIAATPNGTITPQVRLVLIRSSSMYPFSCAAAICRHEAEIRPIYCVAEENLSAAFGLPC